MQYDDLMKNFNKMFTDNFMYNNIVGSYLKMFDKAAGFKFETSLNQDRQTYFLF